MRDDLIRSLPRAEHGVAFIGQGRACRIPHGPSDGDVTVVEFCACRGYALRKLGDHAEAREWSRASA